MKFDSMGVLEEMELIARYERETEVDKAQIYSKFKSGQHGLYMRLVDFLKIYYEDIDGE